MDCTSLITVDAQNQLVLPVSIVSLLGLAPGDIAEISVENERAVVKPGVPDFPETDESLSTQEAAGLQASLAEAKAGATFGPYQNLDEMFEELDRQARAGQ